MFKIKTFIVSIFLLFCACTPYHKKKAGLKEELPQISCQRINKAQRYKLVIFCESEGSYHYYLTKKPWFRFSKMHYQKYLKYLISEFLKKYEYPLDSLREEDMYLWIYVSTFAADNIKLYAQVYNLLFEVDMLPKNWEIAADKVYYFSSYKFKFPNYMGKRLGKIELSLSKMADSRKVASFLKNFPEVSVVSKGESRYVLALPYFQELDYSRQIYNHPVGRSIIKNILPLSQEKVPVGLIKKVSQFDF